MPCAECVCIDGSSEAITSPVLISTWSLAELDSYALFIIRVRIIRMALFK